MDKYWKHSKSTTSHKKILNYAMWEMAALWLQRISQNQIRKIHSRSFNESKCLISIDLRYNFISDISPLAFKGLVKTEVLGLHGNHLITLAGWRLWGVYLADDPCRCSCLLKWIKREYKWRIGTAQSINKWLSVHKIRNLVMYMPLIISRTEPFIWVLTCFVVVHL